MSLPIAITSDKHPDGWTLRQPTLLPGAEDFLKVPSRQGERRTPYRPPSISAYQRSKGK